MNPVTITIQVDPINEDSTHLYVHVTHPRGERTWQGTYQGSPLRASLGGIWLALRELDNARIIKCIVNLKVNQAARDTINDFLWQTATGNVADVYEYLRPLLRKHTILIGENQGMLLPDDAGVSPASLIGEIQRLWGHRHLRTRLPRAAQLVSMGAIQNEVRDGISANWEICSQTQPNGMPYLVKSYDSQGLATYQCNCLDSNPSCKHILAVIMQCNILHNKGE